MSSHPVLVFGATGTVGSRTALAAADRGAQVTMAMRDTQRKVPGLTLEQEKTQEFARIRADLNDPTTISEAARQSGAKRAFIYIDFATTDHMRASLEALRTGGVEFVVFLSSLTFQGHPKDSVPKDIIAYAHAQVELNLAEVFGPHGFIAVRPGYFATNNLRLRAGMEGNRVKVAFPDVKFDWIVAEDIGEVCGELLANGPGQFRSADHSNVLKLCGADMTSQREAVATIARAIGRDLQVEALASEQGVQLMVENHIPEPIARLTMDHWQELDRSTREAYTPDIYNEGYRNVQRYTGHAPRTFQWWVDNNKELFRDWGSLHEKN